MLGAPLEADFYDGISAIRQNVLVHAYIRSLRLTHEDGRYVDVPLAALRQGQHHGPTYLIENKDIFGWRLRLVCDGAPPAWLSALEHAQSTRSWLARMGYANVLAAASLVVVLGVVVAYNFIDWAVALLPRSTMVTLGDSVVSEVAEGAGLCEGQAGLSALNDLVNRMFPKGFDEGYPLRVQVINQGTTNAFATPGGRVVLFRGLIEAAQSPDEVAGVLAHEFGHVHHQHPERSLVRAFSLGLILSFFGGDTGALANGFLTLANSRDYEREADAQALAALKRIEASPQGFANFFERLAKESAEESSNNTLLGSIFANVGPYLSTHPELGVRAEQARAQVQANYPYKPSLSPSAWLAVQNVCQDASGQEAEQAREEAPASPENP
jgi:beta-barrel assembly-enhancing protease